MIQLKWNTTYSKNKIVLLKKITNHLFIIVTLLHVNKPQNVADESNVRQKKKKVQELQNLTVLQD